MIRLPAATCVRLTVYVALAWIVGSPTLFAQSSSSGGGGWQADPELIESLSKKRTDFNYREQNVPDFELPDPLRRSDGNGRVQSAQQWSQERRPVLLQTFRDHVYGNRPDTEFEISYEIVQEESNAFDGTAIAKQVRATIDRNGKSLSFDFVMCIPKSERPVPAIVHINNRYFLSLDQILADEDPFWPAKTIVSRGYATASFHTKHVDPDRRDGYDEGVRALLDDGDSDPMSRWKSLSAWGWAGSRVLDYVLRQDGIADSGHAIVGHSRGGKTALWAAAEDERFAVAYSNDSGCGGAALSRRAFGETVARINRSFPYWFCDRFKTYNDRVNELPIDQHDLIALIAPRRVYVASADQDLWADPRGEYLSVVSAAPVYQLFGKETIQRRSMPKLDSPRHTEATGYHIRRGEHNLKHQDWGYFLDFLDAKHN
ncbi:acetylxylan esterase [Roseiconus lacunae]|uniref:alpha/beta hydrolase family protein n=1 Tax=Roseiconus lacunae TaxID=2605694 RepID=UPI003085CFA4|nr:acetylxylan esterase [Stieleria sp. HD01]